MGHNRNSTRHTTRRIATCGVFCALAVVVLGMGAIFEVLDITASAVAALTLLPILLCYGKKYAWLAYAVTAVLGVLLMPQSLATWMYAGLAGFYPMIKMKLDRLPRLISWLVKLVLLAAVLTLYLAVFYFIMLGGEGSFTDAFFKGFGETDGAPVMAYAAVGLATLTFVLFDMLIDRVLVLYYVRWQKRVEKWLKP